MSNRRYAPPAKAVVFAVMAALLPVAGLSAGQAGAAPESGTGVTLDVWPLKAQYFNEPRILVDFEYRVTSPRPDGEAVVTLFNVDSGAAFTKRFAVELDFGRHHHWAAWGGETGPWTSSKASELDLLLDGELATDEPVPDGFYIPQVTIRGPDGAVLAEQKYSDQEIRHLRATGKVAHKLSRETILAKGEEIRQWLRELKSLEARARAAGADTSLPGLMITAMEQTDEMCSMYIGGLFYDVVINNHAYCALQVPKTRAQLERLVADPASGQSIDLFSRPRPRLAFKDGYFHHEDRPVFLMGMCMFALWPDLDLMRRMNYNLVHIGANPLCLFPDDEDPAAASARARARSEADLREFLARETLDIDYHEADRLNQLLPPEEAPATPGMAPASNGPPSVAAASAPRPPSGGPAIPAPTGKLLVADYNDKKLTVRRFLDRCSELGIKVDLGLNMHPAPQWFFDQHPDARLQGYSVAGFIPFDIEHPAALELTERFLDAAMKEVANHPALNSIWLANEPSLYNMGPLSAARFRAEMREKYGSIGAFNAAMGTAYADFEAVEPPPLGSGSRLGTEYWWFNLRRLTHFFTFMQQCVRKHDKTVSTCFKLNNLQMGWYCPPMNVDQEAVTDISEIIGMDSGTMPFARPYYDWLRSLSPEKPLVNLEFKGGGDATWLTMWRAALWGMAAIDWWCWHPKPTFSSAMCYTVALHEGPLAMAQVQRNLDVVMAFQQFPRSPFVFLYPDPVLPRARSYFEVHTPVHHAVTRLGYAVDYATEKRIAEGRLDQMAYAFIVLPAANFIRDETFARVGAFVARGGQALVVGDPPALGPMGQPRDLGWLKPPPGAARGIAGCTNSLVFSHGRGRVWMLPEAPEASLNRWIGELADATLPPRPVVVDPAFESRTIPWKHGPDEEAYVTYILANYYQEWDGDGDARVDAVFSRPVAEAVDLISGERLDPANITMPRFGARLIRWKPAK